MNRYKIFNKQGELILETDVIKKDKVSFMGFINKNIINNVIKLADIDIARSIKLTNHENSLKIKIILLIDDDPIIRSSFEFYSNQIGHYITTVASAEEAMELITENPYLYELVFIDKYLPGIDGDKFALKLKSYSKETQIHIITGSPEDVLDGIESRGIKSVITKPVQLSKFIQITDYAWNNK